MDLRAAFEELVSEAQKLGNSLWAETGNMAPQQNAMFATLWIKIKELESRSQNKE